MEHKLQKEELDILQEQQQRYNQALFELGAFEAALFESTTQLETIKKEKQNLLGDIKTLRDKASDYQKKLVEKYGDIEINLGTGEFLFIK